MATFTIDLNTGQAYLFSTDVTGGTSSSGSTYPVVGTYSELPAASTETGKIYLVRTATGDYIVERKEGGLYFSNGISWVRLGDIPSFFSSDNFQVYDSDDNTKGVEIITSGLTTNTFRRLTVQDSDGTIAYLTDLDLKVDLSLFNIYSGNTESILNTKVNDSTFNGHTGDTTIHYPQSGISITESQISDFGTYVSGITFNLYTGTTAPSTFLKLDQTIPQTVSGGSPQFDGIQFNTANTTSPEEGEMNWNGDDGTMEIGMQGGNVYNQIGLELMARVTNKTGGDLLNGQLVYCDGAQGSRPTVILASASDLNVGVKNVGILTEDIANNQSGYVTTFGIVRELNTLAYSAGTVLYLSTTAGTFTNIPPQAPNYTIPIGTVLVQNQNTGQIQFHPAKSYKVTDLADVDGTPLTTNGQIMVWDQDRTYFDFDYNINDYTLNSDFNSLDGSGVYVSGTTGITFQDWMNYTQSAGRLTIEADIQSNGDGTVSVGAGTGLIKTEMPTATGNTARELVNWGEVIYVTWTGLTSLALTDDAYNYIYYDGSDRTIKATIDINDVSYYDDFTLGRVYRLGNEVTIRICGMNLWNFNRRVQMFGEENFPVVRAKGLMLGETGTRNITVTDGVLWAELVNRFTTIGIDTSLGDTFYSWYYNGTAWVRLTGQTQINNQQYNDITTGLVNLTNNRYGVHWIYVVHDSTVHDVFGLGNYTLAEAELAQPPVMLPGLVSAYGTLIGRIIIQQGATTFTAVESAFATTFTPTLVTEHNDLSSIQGGTIGEYYHLTEDELTLVQTGITANTLNKADKILTVENINTTPYTVTSADLSKQLEIILTGDSSIILPTGLTDGFNVSFFNLSGGTATITGGTGTNVYSINHNWNSILGTQFGHATAYYYNNNWRVYGDVT